MGAGRQLIGENLIENLAGGKNPNTTMMRMQQMLYT